MKIPPPIVLEDDAGIGTSVYDLEATDSDGTSPGNKVRFEIIGRGKSTKYFQIDPDSGKLKVINDLKKEVDTEYQVMFDVYAVTDSFLVHFSCYSHSSFKFSTPHRHPNSTQPNN